MVEMQQMKHVNNDYKLTIIYYTRKGRATHGNNLYQQSSTAVTQSLLIATHFTDPERMLASMCQAREYCVRELNLGHWRQKQV